ncbi:DNA polymerase III subunit chi [Allopusillimonas ginsengisoli]|uniref:DNA polymerase III subunit chi n=1 Tax=Allopusillimonas ginsengisoli TaxID=453575 RepID=UPI0010C228A4|nr:DNA polymerase III subunit chi [Allopusillimonas ginsengisoli]
MSRIDFAFGASDRLRMACEVAGKQFAAGRLLLVYTQDAARLAKFDRLLWGYSATAFIPHVMAEDPLASQTPILLSQVVTDEPLLNRPGSWLLNLDLQIPPHAGQFERILEIVSGHDQDKRAARERWRQYEAAGHDVRAHDVSGRDAGKTQR